MDYSFKPCRFGDRLHDFPEEAFSKLPISSGGDSIVVRRHLGLFTRIMIIYCRPPQFNHEDIKMRLFVLSLEDDALNWFNNFPKDSFTSLQDIVNAFKDRYGYPNSLPSKTVQQNESNLIKGPADGERSQKNSSYQNVSSTGTVADQVHDSGKSGTNDDEREEQKQIIQDLMTLVKNMESNQTNYINDVRTLCTHLEKRNREMEIVQNQHVKEIEAMKTKYETEIRIMQSKISGLEENMVTMKADHDREIDSMQNKLLIMDEEMTIMTFDHNNQLATMQANHEEEINSIQHCLMDIKEKNDKVIKNMEEHHARQISAIKVEHSSQMDAIKIQVQKFQQWSDDKRNQGTSTDQEPSHLLQQVPSYYEEVIDSIERWLIEGDPDKLKNDKDQMQDKERHVTHILHTSSDSFETESSRSSVIQPAAKKKRKRKRMRRRFDALDGHEQLDFWIGKSPTICKDMAHPTSSRQICLKAGKCSVCTILNTSDAVGHPLYRISNPTPCFFRIFISALDS